ncbi:MAG: circadian clock KaiB family protein, partial [Chromatocurvus sp.]
MPESISLEFYLAGEPEVRRQLEADLREALEEAGFHAKITVIDVLNMPEKALENDVFATPTLRRILPAPVKKVIANAARMQAAVLLVA